MQAQKKDKKVRTELQLFFLFGNLQSKLNTVFTRKMLQCLFEFVMVFFIFRI